MEYLDPFLESAAKGLANVVVTDEPFPIYAAEAFTDFGSFIRRQLSVIGRDLPGHLLHVGGMPIAAWFGHCREC